jgi:hypothetical protein
MAETLKLAKTTQAKASILRQAVAIAASAYGILTAAGVANHLPVAVSAILTAAAPVLYAIEHYVGDPSTGNGSTVVTAVEKIPEAARIEAAVKAELAKILGLAPAIYQSGVTLPEMTAPAHAAPTPGA